MRYVKTFESFKNSRGSINEEFIGGLLKNLKNKLSLGFSKMFGNASKVDKLMEEYKKEIMTAWTKKKDALSVIGKFQKAIKDGGEKDDEKFKQILNNLKVVDTNYQKEKDLIKKKFDLKFNEIVKEEKNEKIKFYINLKKIEMEQDLLQQESKALLEDTGLTEEDIKASKELSEIMSGINQKAQESQKAIEEQTTELKSDKAPEASGEQSKFDFEAAKKDEKYNWKDSKYTKDYKFESGEELKYWSNKQAKEDSDYKGSTAFVSDNQEDVEEGMLKVYLEDKNKSFGISKGKIISTKKDEEAKEKEGEKPPPPPSAA